MYNRLCYIKTKISSLHLQQFMPRKVSLLPQKTAALQNYSSERWPQLSVSSQPIKPAHISVGFCSRPLWSGLCACMKLTSLTPSCCAVRRSETHRDNVSFETVGRVCALDDGTELRVAHSRLDPRRAHRACNARCKKNILDGYLHAGRVCLCLIKAAEAHRSPSLRSVANVVTRLSGDVYQQII